MGGRVLGLGSRMVRIFNEEERSECTKSQADIGGFGGQLGPRYPAYQHTLPEGPPYVSTFRMLLSLVQVHFYLVWRMTVVGVYERIGSNINY